jgi:hypothetical protein
MSEPASKGMTADSFALRQLGGTFAGVAIWCSAGRLATVIPKRLWTEGTSPAAVKLSESDDSGRFRNALE